MAYKGVIKNKRLVVEEPVDLPDGTEVEVEVHPAPPTPPDLVAILKELRHLRAPVDEETNQALAREAQGMWKDHPDIKDSVSWVRAIRQGLSSGSEQ